LKLSIALHGDLRHCAMTLGVPAEIRRPTMTLAFKLAKPVDRSADRSIMIDRENEVDRRKVASFEPVG
jgi:hypothetical protein